MKNISLYIDIAFCIVVLPVMAMIFPVERWCHNFPWYVAIVGAWLYSLYFINRGFTVPYLFKDRYGRWAGILMIALSITVTYMLTCITLYTPKPNIHDYGIARVLPSIEPYQQAVWSLFMIVEAFSFVVGLLTQTNIQRARRREVEAERDRAEIELYKAQIKPHFMFNTLNALYGLFLTGSDKALASLEKFIMMMRYVHKNSMCNLVPLSEEVDYIRQYVDIQSLRLNEMTTVTLHTDIDNDSLAVPPMLLVTFVENCFKHGVSPIEKSRITLSLTEHDGRMEFVSCNRIFPVKRIGEHMGIENCRKRLELLFPKRHSLEIDNDGYEYHVKLNINLTL